MKALLLAGAAVGVLATLSIPAAAADRISPVTAYTGASWADVTAAFGFWHSTRNGNNTSHSQLYGEGRVGFGAFGFPFQVDVGAQSNDRSNTNNTDVTHMDLAAHVGFYNLAGGGIGAMVSTGSGTGDNSNGNGQRAMTIGLEGVWGLNVLGGSRLVAQGGWSSRADGTTASYIHAVLEVLLQQNVMLSVNGGFANTSDTEHYTRFGAKGEFGLNPMVSAFVQGDWLQKTEGSTTRNDNRFLAGLTFHVNQGSLATVSPLHDYNLFTGVNADMKH